MKRYWRALFLGIFLLGSSTSYCTELPSVPSETHPAPYTLPWQLRPANPINAVRLDSALASYADSNGNAGGMAVAAMLGGSYKISENFAIFGRVGMINNIPPAGSPGGVSFDNSALTGCYTTQLSKAFRLSSFLGVTVPIGTGGGNTPDPAVRAANAAATLARSAMDNSMFSVNYLALIFGLDLAYIANGFTVQYEATLFQLTRVQGELIDPDPARTNFTTAFSVGYSLLPWLSVSGEIHEQRWLINPTVWKLAHPPVENLSFMVGPRFSCKVWGITARPGIAYGQGLIGPIASPGFTSPTNSDKILFIDLPIPL